MQQKTKVYTMVFAALLMMSIILAVVPMASAAGAITLNPTTQAPGSSVTVDGTGFGATKAVGIGLGAEVTVTDEAHDITNVAIGPDGDGVYGPFTAKTNHYPIKPGSFSFHCVVSSETNVVESDYIDKDPPDGTLYTESTYAINPFVNYVTGEFGRSSSSDWSAYTVTFTASYTYYTYNVTPVAGVTTLASGTFTASITVPSVADGNYVVTAVDTAGNKATANLNVVPEGLTLGVMLTLSTIAVIISTRYFRKQPKTERYNSVKV
jgi:hypothetical protein